MKYYLYRCEGCSVIKAMGGFGGEEAVYHCKICDVLKIHHTLSASESDICIGVIRSEDR